MFAYKHVFHTDGQLVADFWIVVLELSGPK